MAEIGRRSILGLVAATTLPAVLPQLDVPQAAAATVPAELSTSAGYAVPERAPLTTTNLTATSRLQSEIMVAMDRNRVRGWNCYSGTLKETRDEGVTWTTVRTFAGEIVEAVLPLDNGELLVFVQVTATTMRRAYLSSGYGSGSASWSVVLNGSNPQIKFASAWGLSVHENIVLANGRTAQNPIHVVHGHRNYRRGQERALHVPFPGLRPDVDDDL